MAKLTAAERKKLPSSDFAIPPDHYPIEDRGHALAALSEVAKHGTPEEVARVKAAVAHKFPGIQVAAHH